MTLVAIDPVRQLERASIRAFVESCADLFTGRVLDYGCGKRPYQDVIDKAGGDYVAFDRAEFPANISVEDIGPDHPLDGDEEFDTILCTQVLQYVYDVPTLLRAMRRSCKTLVLTYPTAWDIVEAEDLWRWTPIGMSTWLHDVGFEVERNEIRAAVEYEGFRFPLGGGVVARA